MRSLVWWEMVDCIGHREVLVVDMMNPMALLEKRMAVGPK